MEKLTFMLVVLMFVLAMPFASHATFLDFRTDAWSGAAGQHSFTKALDDGLNLTISAWRHQDPTQPDNPKKIAWNYPSGYRWDGLGVIGGWAYDEIDANGEFLKFVFSDPVRITGFFFTDKFAHSWVTEAALVSINSTTVGPFCGGDSFNGESTVMFEGIQGQYLKFWAPPASHKTNYSVGGIYYEPAPQSVPEPPMSWMVVIGALLLLVSRRRLVRNY